MPNQLDDRQLLRQYVQNRSADAFEQIVRRYAGIVLASAQRQVRDLALAEDVTQAVFIVLTRKAPSLVNLPTLGGWLMKVARYAAIDAMRKQNRQRRHEQAAAIQRPELQKAQEVSDCEWAQLSSVLDEAIARLGSTDRDALVLRYFQDQSYSTIASKLGMKEEAARKRVGRALEKLHGMLSRRGIALPAGAIVAGVSANASASISPALFGSIMTGATIGVSASGLGLSIAKGAINMMTWAKATAAAAIVAAAVLVTGGTIGISYVLAQPRAAAPATAPAVVNDRASILGTWYQLNPLSSATRAALPGVTGPLRLVVTETELQFPDQNANLTTRYTIDPATKHIDLIATGQRALGLYQVEGDLLKIAVPFRDGVDRPTAMSDGPQARVMLFSRNKPGTTPPAADLERLEPLIKAATLDVNNLQLAFDAFQIDTGRYPASEEGLGALLKAPLSITKWRGPYVRQIPIDPWGRVYSYQYPGKHRPAAPEIWSAGPDGQDGTLDDITSWSK